MQSKVSTIYLIKQNYVPITSDYIRGCNYIGSKMAEENVIIGVRGSQGDERANFLSLHVRVNNKYIKPKNSIFV